jgi:hypothetical protein
MAMAMGEAAGSAGVSAKVMAAVPIRVLASIRVKVFMVFQTSGRDA